MYEKSWKNRLPLLPVILRRLFKKIIQYLPQKTQTNRKFNLYVSFKLNFFQFFFTLWDFAKIVAGGPQTAVAIAADPQPQGGVRYKPTKVILRFFK